MLAVALVTISCRRMTEMTDDSLQLGNCHQMAAGPAFHIRKRFEIICLQNTKRKLKTRLPSTVLLLPKINPSKLLHGKFNCETTIQFIKII